MNEDMPLRHPEGCNVFRTNDGMAVEYADTIHTLNTTAGEIFDLCDGTRTRSDIIREMQARYPSNDTVLHVQKFLDQLAGYGLIVECVE